jgi:hypothetical protein
MASRTPKHPLIQRVRIWSVRERLLVSDLHLASGGMILLLLS